MRRVEVTGPVRPDVAWERYADLASWTTWAPQIRGVEADGGRLAVGRRGLVRTLAGFTVPFTVTDVDHAAMTWSWIAHLGPVALTLHHDLMAVPDGTRAGLTLEGLAPVVAAYAPLTRVPLGRLVRR